MAKVSIIIPVYNIAPYLKQCLDSVIRQTLHDIEILLVDDGSTDGSAEICRAYAQSDARIHLLTSACQGGVVRARKAGVEAASSLYIGFVDGDDYIDPDMYEILLQNIGNADMITSAAYKDTGRLWQDGIPSGSYTTPDEMAYVFNNMLMMGDTFQRGISGTSVCKLYRAAIARDVFQTVNPNIYLGEDVEFVCRYLLKCRSVTVTNICKYHYRLRENSASHSVHHDLLGNLNALYLSLSHAFHGHPHEARLMEQLQRYLLYYIPILPRLMGFAPTNKILRYISPSFNDLIQKRIVLYGAGDVGQDYYLHMARRGNPPALWVDKNHEKYPLFPVKSIISLEKTDFDCVVLAVKDEKLAQEIRAELIHHGIAADKLLWEAPIQTR